MSTRRIVRRLGWDLVLPLFLQRFMPYRRDKPHVSGAAVPKAAVVRLSLYLRELEHLRREGFETTSSTALGRRLSMTAAQVRKDLTHFGQFGCPGIGYRCAELIEAIKQIVLGDERTWNVAVVGVGNLGRALLGYKGFERRGFRIVAAFDVQAEKVGRVVEGVPTYGLSELPVVARQLGIRLAILAVPARAAQEVSEQLADAGIEGVLNFAPRALSLPGKVAVSEADVTIHLEQLSFAVVNRGQRA